MIKSFLVLSCFLIFSSFIYENNLSYFGGKVNFFSVNGTNNYQIFQFERPSIKVKYFGSTQNGESVALRFKKWRAGKNVVLACSGTYSINNYSNNYVPDGLCIDDGFVVNNSINNNLGAFVIVEKVGGIRVFTKESGVICQSVGSQRLYPASNALDRVTFIEWAKKESATVFQTHCLFFSGQKRCNNYSSDIRERRILAICENSNKKINYFILNLPTANPLNICDANDLFLGQIKAKGYSPIALVNLDVGNFDIIHVYDENGNNIDSKFSDLKSRVDFNSSKNIIAFYIE